MPSTITAAPTALIMSDCRRFPSMTIRIPTAQEVTIARSLIL